MAHSLPIAKCYLLAGAAIALAALPCAAMAEERSSAVEQTAASDDVYTASAELMRLENIGFRLASSNGDKCDAPEMLSGLVVHDISDYDAKIRPEIAAKSGLSFGFGVLGIVAGSPAEYAGIKVGDEIVSINGVQLRDKIFENLPITASYARIENFSSNLSDALRHSVVELGLIRNGQKLTVAISGVSGCGGRVSLQQSKQLNAWSDGRYVAVTTRMMSFAKNDAELAFVVAHEMAHNIKKHAAALRSRSALLASFGFGAGKFYKSETEADDFAISLLASTDFSLSGARGLLSRFSNFSLLYMSPTHPTFGRRVEIVSDAIRNLRQPQIQLASLAPKFNAFSNMDVYGKGWLFQRNFTNSNWAVDGNLDRLPTVQIGFPKSSNEMSAYFNLISPLHLLSDLRANRAGLADKKMS